MRWSNLPQLTASAANGAVNRQGKFNNMKRIILPLFFVILAVANLSAQTAKRVTGVVKDSTGKEVANATVSLYAFSVKRDTLRKLSNNEGVFSFSGVTADDFKIEISATGFAGFSKIFHYPEAKDLIDVGVLELSIKPKELQEVIVTANKTVTIKEDTLEFKADSIKLKPDADVEALLKKIPGVQVDANGNITAYGKSVTKIRVNGKDFFSGDIKTATKELPANIVDLVQVIDDYGDQASFTGVKDGDPEKIINLKIKKDKNKGYFGRGQIGYGTDERYTVNGSINRFNNDQQISMLANFNNTNTSTFSLPGRSGSGMMRGGMPDNGTMSSMMTIMNNGDGGFLQSGQTSNDGISRTNSAGINYRDDWGKKLSVYGSYTFTNRNTVTLSNTKQTNLFETGNIVNTYNTTKTENSTSHRVFLNAEWKIDSFNQVKFTPSFSYNKTSTTSISDFLFNGSNNLKLNEGTSNETTISTQPNFSGSILYNHRFKKPGRLFSLNLTGGKSSGEQEDDRINNSVFYPPNGGTATNNNQHQLVTQDNSNPSAGARLSYTEPINKKKSIEFNYSYNKSFTSNDRQTYLIDNSGQTRLDSLSNLFENTFTYQRYGVNYRFNEKKYNYSIGLAAQSNRLKGESFINKANYSNNSFNWFPQARFTYNFSRTRNLSVSYNANVSAPSSSQLQPVYDYSEPQYPVIGNPNLNPEVKSTFSVRYGNFDFQSGNILFSNLSFSTTRNKVVTNSVNKTTSGSGGQNGAIQETQYVNANGYYNASGFYNFSKPFQDRKYVLTFNGNINYTNDVSFVNSQKNNSKNFVATQGFNTDVRLKDWLEVGAGGSFTYNGTKNSLTPQANTEVKTYTISSNGKIYLPGKFVLNYDLNKNFNSGYGVSANPFIINGYLEKQFAKSSQFSLRLSAYDLLNQNVNISRSVTANSITDTRTNKLGQYFMLSFNFKLQKFKGQQPKVQLPSGPPPEGARPPGL